MSEGGRSTARHRAAGAGAAAPKTRIAFVDMGRAIAALLIVYSHIDSLLLRQNLNRGSWLTDTIDGLVAPLGLKQDAIGYLSVPFFFLVSGFVVPPVAQKIGSLRFTVKFLCRLLPLLVFAVALAAVAVAVGLRPLTTGQAQPVTAGKVLQNMFLVNFLHKPIDAYVGVSWSLVPEVTFYLLLIALIPLHRKLPWLAIAVELEFVFVVLMFRGQLGVEFRDFAANTSYVTLAIIGQSAFTAWRRRIPYWLGGLYAALAFALYGWASTMNIDPDYVLVFKPVCYSVVLFALGLAGERWLRQRAIWTALSERTYALYLLHGVVAFPVMFLLYHRLPLWLDALVGVVAMFAVVEFAYRFVDRPMNNLGRRWSGSRAVSSAAVPPLADPASGEFGSAGPVPGDTGEFDEYDDDYDEYEDLPPVPAPRLIGPVTSGVLPMAFLPARATPLPHQASDPVSGAVRPAPRAAPAARPPIPARPGKEEPGDVVADSRAGHGRHALPHPADDHPRPARTQGRHAAKPAVNRPVRALPGTQLPRRGATSPDS